jgi:hypothetical protein
LKTLVVHARIRFVTQHPSPELPLFLDLELAVTHTPKADRTGRRACKDVEWSLHGPHISKLVAGEKRLSHVRFLLQKLDLDFWKLEAKSISLGMKKREGRAN